MERQPEQARGEHYFRSGDCPIGVRTVTGGGGSRHSHDLTGVPHVHDFAELVIITGGRGEQRVNGGSYPVSAGDVFLLQGFSEHYFPEPGAVSMYNVQFDPTRLPLPQQLLRKIPGYNVVFQLEPSLRSLRNFRQRLHLSPTELAAAESLVQRLAHELERTDPGMEAGALAALLELIVYISCHYLPMQPERSGALERLGEVLSRLERDCRRPWQLPELARLAGLSVNHFLRLFKAATGSSPMAYLNRLRLRRAAALLAQEHGPVAEVAARCGFADSNYFTKQFRQCYGVSPRAYRRAIQGP